MRQRRLRMALILAVMVPLLFAAAPSSVSAVEKLTACLPDINVPYGIFGIAQKMGYYEEEGLALDLSLMKGGICEIEFLLVSEFFGSVRMRTISSTSASRTARGRREMQLRILTLRSSSLRAASASSNKSGWIRVVP